MKNPEKVKKGKKSRAQGKAFELRVRADLESKGWIVDRWSNNVKFELPLDTYDAESYMVGRKYIKGGRAGNIGKHLVGGLVPAKAKWAGPGRPMMLGAGFPDFVCFELAVVDWNIVNKFRKDMDERYKGTRFDRSDKTEMIYHIIGVESKMGKCLDKEEREKCRWLLDNRIFGRIMIAYKTLEGRKIKINYLDFEEYDKK